VFYNIKYHTTCQLYATERKCTCRHTIRSSDVDTPSELLRLHCTIVCNGHEGIRKSGNQPDAYPLCLPCDSSKQRTLKRAIFLIICCVHLFQVSCAFFSLISTKHAQSTKGVMQAYTSFKTLEPFSSHLACNVWSKLANQPFTSPLERPHHAL
jgi:hypothetical protein